MYYGYSQSEKQYRMMDLPDYMSSVQEGFSRLISDSTNAYQDMMRGYGGGASGTMTRGQRHGRTRDCGCDDCHCECCVCDADVLVHARCGELRRIPLTFENESRRDRPVTLELGKFLSSGGRDLNWGAQLSETQFTLRPCDEHTVTLLVAIRCDRDDKSGEGETRAEEATGGVRSLAENVNAMVANQRFGSVDRCEVGYATIRAEGCLTRPIVVAVAVLPDDCDAYRHPCGCNCCD
jgi:hypothetical protein